MSNAERNLAKITEYELSAIISRRTKQLNEGWNPLLPLEEIEGMDANVIAKLEVSKKLDLPIYITRFNSKGEYTTHRAQQLLNTRP